MRGEAAEAWALEAAEPAQAWVVLGAAEAWAPWLALEALESWVLEAAEEPAVLLWSLVAPAWAAQAVWRRRPGRFCRERPTPLLRALGSSTVALLWLEAACLGTRAVLA